MKQLLNVNSLTDIVSNSVGILIIFAVLNIAHESGKTHQVDVPLEHETEHLPAFFIVKDDAIVYLEPERVFFNAMAQARQGNADAGETFDLGYMRLQGEMHPTLEFIIRPKDTVHWHDISELDEPDSPLLQTLDSLDKEKQYAYFFVYDEADLETGAGSGYAMFRRTRAYLKEHGLQSGWRPVDADNPPHFCFWDDEAVCNNYAPSYRAGE
ncbi:MAG: hypothetical protein GY862_38805 [Gammaproteobacteria bacterium]|nr:hypothetical protein [Gammaproteobacteria bacterium]